jgi:hypothetical protein
MRVGVPPAMLGEHPYQEPFVDVSPDLSQLSDVELKEMIKQLTAEEREVSYQRRLLHGRIELLKSELVSRLKGRDEGELSVVDLDALSRVLAGRLPDLDRLEGGAGGD